MTQMLVPPKAIRAGRVSVKDGGKDLGDIGAEAIAAK